jgi:hypothetical protein
MQRNRLRQPMKLAGRYDNPIPARFLAPMDCSQIPALISLLTLVSNYSDDIGFKKYFFFSTNIKPGIIYLSFKIRGKSQGNLNVKLIVSFHTRKSR